MPTKTDNNKEILDKANIGRKITRDETIRAYLEKGKKAAFDYEAKIRNADGTVKGDNVPKNKVYYRMEISADGNTVKAKKIDNEQTRLQDIHSVINPNIEDDIIKKLNKFYDTKASTSIQREADIDFASGVEEWFTKTTTSTTSY